MDSFVFTRHTSECKYKRDRLYRRCNCPKWVEGRFNSKRIRKSASTRLWDEAERFREKLEEALTKGLPLSDRPAGALPQAPPGFKVQLYADGFMNARLLRTAPNGDLFLADCQAGEIEVLRGVGRDGKVKNVEVFASDLALPFGINFTPTVQTLNGYTLPTQIPLFAFLPER